MNDAFYNWSIHRAINAACRAHDGQFRKGGSGTVPYVSHCFAVFQMVSMFAPADVDAQIAALLHDVLEDAPQHAGLISQFGQRVVDLVFAVSDRGDPKHLAYTDRKRFFVDEIIAGGRTAVLISTCDKIHNMASVVENLSQGRPSGCRPLPQLFGYWRDFQDRALGLCGSLAAVDLYEQSLRTVALFLPIP